MTIYRPAIVLVPVALFLLPVPLAAEDAIREGRLLFGWAQESIVPSRPVAIAGQYETRISGEVHDPLMVTALAVETRDDKGTIDHLIWVSCDMVGIRKKNVDGMRRLVSQSLTDVDPQKIIVSATHTHTAPALTDADETDLHPYDFAGSWAYRIPASDTNVMRPQEFANYFERQIATAVVRAWKSRQPGEYSFALSHASVARNRRAVYFDGTTRMYGDTSDPLFSHTEGTSDDSVDLMFFWRGDQLAGISVTLYCPAQEVEGQKYLSADFWDDTRRLLKERYTANLFVLPLTGASGDQSPHVQVGRSAETHMHQRRGVGYREEIARRVARAIDDVIEGARADRRSRLRLAHRAATIELPVWPVPESRYQEATSHVEREKERLEELTPPQYIRWRVDRTMTARYLLQQTEPIYRAEVHAVRFDDMVLVTNPFELFTDYGLRIKARSPATLTSVVQLTADCAGYLPTERAVLGGGYSGRIDDGVVGPDGGRTLVDQTAKLLQSMWGQEHR